MKQERYSVILRTMLFLTWTFLFATFALNIFGVSTYEPIIYNPNLLQLIDTVNNNVTIRIVFNILFTVPLLNLMFASVIQNYKNYALKANIFIMVYAISINYIYFLPQNIFFDFVLAISVYFIILLHNSKISIVLFVIILDNAFGIISALSKNIFELNYWNVELLIFSSVEIIQLWFLVFLYNKIYAERSLLCYYLDLAQEFGARLNKNFKESLACWRLKSPNVKQKRIILIKKLSVLKQKLQHLKHYTQVNLTHDLKESIPLFVIATIYIGYALFINKPLEAVFLYVAYLKLYKLFPKNMHADFIPGIKPHFIEITCTCLTSLILCTALFMTIGGGVSVISTIIVAFVVNWFSYVIANHLDWERDRPTIKKLKQQEEKRQMLTVENIINVMAECHTPQKYHSYLIATICNGIKDTDYFADESVRLLNIDEQQFRNHKTKFKKELKRRKIL